MNDKLKSSYELALERLKEKGIDEPVESITAEQKAEIVKVRNLFKAKIAELEIGKQSSSLKAISARNFEELEKIQQHFVNERAKLEAEMEREVARVHAAKN